MPHISFISYLISYISLHSYPNISHSKFRNRMWSSFWREFKRENKHWHMLHPMFIHEDYRDQIKSDLSQTELDDRKLNTWLGVMASEADNDHIVYTKY